MGLFLFGIFGTKMARNTKVQKPGDAKLSECEQAIGFALMELESSSDLKAQLRELFIRSAQEVEIGKGKKAIIVFVPVPQLKAFQKIQVRLVRELEQKRPRSRTLVSVHNALLDDLVYPAEIVGKRTRIRLDGSRLFKVHLDKTQQTNIEHKTETYSSVYKKLTGKEVTFEFPEPIF